MIMGKKGAAFRALHQADKAFIMPNPYDVGSAKLLELAGFEAMATTSAGYAFSKGRPDNDISRDEVISHGAEIVAATKLPVSADLENGFFDDPKEVSNTIRMAANVGLVGGSIEDSTNDGREAAQYDLGFAKARISAAADAAKAQPFPFTLTARAENFIVGNPDLGDVIVRLQAYQEAGADVLFAPGVREKKDIETLLRNIDLPLNILLGSPGSTLTRDDLSALGVKRISTGSSLACIALGSFMRAAKELKEKGSFTYGEQAVPFAEINELFKV